MDDFTTSGFSAAGMPASGPVRAHFTGTMPAFRGLIIKGALLQLITLGIYRFWLTTDIRRFEWANTQIGGESAEYTGTAIELLIGFLIAVAILVPLFVLMFLASFALGPAGQAVVFIGYVGLGILGQYAYFRARRYRLTRTLFRGVRLHQDGSAWSYAFRALGWGLVILFTLGLAYPFAQASLERYKLRCTYYGELQGSFVGRGLPLFARGLLLWMIAILPFVLIVTVAATTIDWPALAAAARASRAGRPEILGSNPAFMAAMMWISAAVAWFFLSVVLLYPAFQAIALRWWLNGLRFGEARVSTDLRTMQIYGAYFRYIGWSILVVLAAVAVYSVIVILGVIFFHTAAVTADSGQVIAAVTGFVAYVALALCIWIVYQVTVRLRIWRAMVDSVQITGFEAVESVRADLTRPTSALGEGLVDALGAGGM